MMESFCAARKTTPERAFVQTQKWLGRRDFRDGVRKLRTIDLLSGESNIRLAPRKAIRHGMNIAIVFMLSRFIYFCLLLWVVESAVLEKRTQRPFTMAKSYFSYLAITKKKIAKVFLKNHFKKFFKTLKIYNDVSMFRTSRFF